MPRLFRRRSSILFFAFAFALLAYFATFFQNCSGGTGKADNDLREAYIGDQLCRSCHEQAYNDWLGSHHGLAMQEATAETVLGDFNDLAFTSNGVTSRFFKKDGKFYVNTEGPDGGFQDFEIKYTFGVFPLQQYLAPFPGGRLQCLLTAWDSKENKWFSLQPGERHAPDDWLHWTKGSMTWNTMCADCHSTYLEKNYDEASNTFDTQWRFIDVSCEACHGPGKKHMVYANSSAYKRGERVKGSYMYLTAGISSKEHVEECARCHARRGQISEVFNHSGELMDHYTPSTLAPGLYHPDGQILDEVYVYGSFLQSKMYRRNVRCSSCHNPHSLKLKAVGNALCGQCHVKEKYDTPEHHFHEQSTDGAACINCHMPGKYYMGNDFRRDHSFRIPRPDLSALYGTPNSCNGCHGDKTPEWAAEAVRKWYGPERPPHFSPALAAARSGDLAALPALMAMVGDTSQPEIVQATVVDILAEAPGPEADQKIITALQNGNPLIRYSAVNAMGRFSVENRLRYLAPLLRDSVRAVRTQAAYQLADIDEQLFQGEERKAFGQAKTEFEGVLKAQADFPTGQLMRGQYYHKMGRLEQAAQAYQEAIRQDPYLPQPYFNLANLYYTQGKGPQAKTAFEQLLRLDSSSVEAHYSLGLLLAEMQNLAEAEPHLGRAARLSNNPRYYYNWGLTLQNLNRPAAAENAFQQGLAIDANSEALLYALAVLYIQQQRTDLAGPVVSRLLELSPDNPDYLNLLRNMR
ncbi:MAG: tetratricopeptide repeat protein [Phaeodactylibacter sp.]|nr:tetratricopeptide repeat protein [Phaeodactylibacter sp.]MCB9273644.1 tetratricopeptide repeat protein [Lewinellaceae bacterium]